MKQVRWGQVCHLKYGKALRDYSEDPSEVDRFRVFGTNGPIGWCSEPLCRQAGIVIGRKGAYRGVHYSSGPFFVIDTAFYLELSSEEIDLRWAYYKLLTVDINAIDVGSAIPTTSRDQFHALPLSYPAMPAQKAIAETLATYDDLIDNNRRRIKLLEDSMRLLFDEWFVRQQLPPHLETKTEEEPLHLSVADLCVEVKAQVLPETIDADTPYIGLEHMPRRSITLSDWGAATDVTSAKLLYAEGDVIFGKIRPYFHKVGVALTDGVCSSDAIVMRPQAERWRPLLLALVSSDAFIAATAQGMKEGSKMPRADWKQMRAYSVCVPNPRVLSAFNGVVEPVLQQVKTLALQSRKLRTARDLLLPRLMSGELAV